MNKYKLYLAFACIMHEFCSKQSIMNYFISLLTVSAFLLVNSVNAQTWTQIPSGTNKNLTAISFPSSNVGYICGEDSLLLKTTNGGQTWTPINFSGITFYPNGYDIVDVKFVSDLIGFVSVGPYTGTYKTVDGGLTWSMIDNIYICYNLGIYFFDENNGFIGGSGCFSGEIINKLDNGTLIETNINPSFIQSTGMINNYDFNTSSMGLATSFEDYFFRTLDGGFTWDTIPNSLPSSDSLTSVLFINNSTVLATYLHDQSAEYGVLISNDAGLTWQADMNFATFFYPRMYASEKSGNGHVYIGGENSFTGGGIEPGLIYESNGSMSNWSYETVAEGIRDMDSYGDSVVFGVGQNGYIVVNQNLSSLALNTYKIENDFKVFPNPNTGEFTIQFGNEKIDKIQILDAFGRLVYENFEVTNPEINIALPNIKSGIYTIRTEQENKLSVQQIVLL